MYSILPSFVLGFHGCEREVGEKVLSGKSCLLHSNNNYDWLGNRIYFWENNPDRALEFAKITKKFKDPFVIGAVINLGFCLNLLDSRYLGFLKQGYEILNERLKKLGTPLPENKPVKEGSDLIFRALDCAVIETVHKYYIDKENKKFDSVRGVFIEGKPLYPNAGFNEKNHIQICVTNPNCIKGYFRKLEELK